MQLLLTRVLTLSRQTTRISMSTVTVSPAMAILDKLIDHVTNLPANTAPSSQQSSAAASSSSSSSTTSSYLPSHTTDIAWRPIIPIGHTKYTWVGDDDISATATTTTLTTTATTAATPASSLTTAAVPRPDSAAAASAALSVPPAAKSVKEKKGAAQPSKGKKEEEKKTDQPDISRIDIRVGQITRAWRHPEGELPTTQPQPYRHTDTHSE